MTSEPVDPGEGTPLRIVETGGDAACWAAQLCPDCGALTEDPSAPCWRCGRQLDTEG